MPGVGERQGRLDHAHAADDDQCDRRRNQGSRSPDPLSLRHQWEVLAFALTERAAQPDRGPVRKRQREVGHASSADEQEQVRSDNRREEQRRYDRRDDVEEQPRRDKRCEQTDASLEHERLAAKAHVPGEDGRQPDHRGQVEEV